LYITRYLDDVVAEVEAAAAAEPDDVGLTNLLQYAYQVQKRVAGGPTEAA
jgi:hypothetical protein